MVGRYDEPMRSIGEVAESLDLPQHVLRFWETRFKEIDPLKRAGGRRLYRDRDVEIVIAIRHLLYNEGYTIKGVQRILKEQGVDAVVADVARRLNGEAEATPQPREPEVEEDFPASDGDIDEIEAEGEEPDSALAAAAPSLEVDAPAPVAEPPRPSALPAIPEPPPRRLDEADARILREALAEIEECQRLLKLTIR